MYDNPPIPVLFTPLEITIKVSVNSHYDRTRGNSIIVRGDYFLRSRQERDLSLMGFPGLTDYSESHILILNPAAQV